MTTIRLDSVVRTFGGVRAVDDVSITIAQGELFTLLGPSGCGKTTLLRMIAGFSEVEHGSIWFGDRRIDQLAPHRRNIGMVFQSYAIFPNLTVEQNVAYGLRARRIDRQEICGRVGEALALVQLAAYRTRWPHELSGGQLQRVAIARSLVIKPAVLIFDEPLSNLDAQLRTHMRVEIRQLQRSLGLTVVYVTHDQEEALAISDRVAVLRSGRIEQIGTPEAIYRTPQTAFVAEFMGATNMLSGIVVNFDGVTSAVAAGGATFQVCGQIGTPGGRVLLSIRPETMRVVEPLHAGVPTLRVQLQLREFLGPILRLHTTLPDGTPLRIAALAGQGTPSATEGTLWLTYDPARINVFPAL